jgi:uncharacterized protein with FMN-binding domain
MRYNKSLSHRKLMKYYFVFSALLVLVILFTGCSLLVNNLDSFHATLPSLSGKADGVYRGMHNVSPFPVEVELDVTVKNERIDAIDIVKHASSPIGKQAEIIIPQIIEKQSLSIDAVSGATASSKTILKAVENALQ